MDKKDYNNKSYNTTYIKWAILCTAGLLCLQGLVWSGGDRSSFEFLGLLALGVALFIAVQKVYLDIFINYSWIPYYVWAAYVLFSFLHFYYNPTVCSALSAVLLFPIAASISKYREYSFLYGGKLVLAVIAGMYGSLIIPVLMGNDPMIGMGHIMAACLACFMVGIIAFANKRSSAAAKIIKLLGLGVVMTLVSLFIMSKTNTNYAQRLSALSSSEYAIAVKNVLINSKLFGHSDILLSDGSSALSYLSQYTGSTNYQLIIRFGKGAFLAGIAAAFGLAFAIHKMGSHSKNSYTYYLLNGISSYFLIRTCFVAIGFFVLFSVSEVLPFMGYNAWIVMDWVLLAAAVSLYKKSFDEEVSEMLDKKYDPKLDELSWIGKVMRLNLSYIEDDIDEYEEETDAERIQALQYQRKRLEQRLKTIDQALELEDASKADVDEYYEPYMVVRRPKAENIRTLIFISHNRHDEAFTKALADRIEKNGLKCWYSERDVQDGIPYGGQIVEALEHTKIMIVLLTKHSVDSHHVVAETDIAFDMYDKGLVILPVRLEDIAVNKTLTYYLKGYNKMAVYKLNKQAQIMAITDRVLEMMKKA